MQSKLAKGEISTIVIFTENYPYLPGEQFIEEEIYYLAEKFKHVIVIPRRAEGQPRALPSNARVDLSVALQKSISHSAFLSLFAINEFFHNFGKILHPRGLKRYIDFLSNGARVLHWIKASELDLAGTIFYSYWLAHSAVGIAMACRWNSQVRFVSRAHGWDVYEDRHIPHYLPFRDLIFSEIDNLFTISKHGHDHLRSRIKNSNQHIEVARLGVAAASTLAKGSKDGVIRIASCSSIISVKRLDRLIAGLVQLAHISPDIHVEWTHFGDGPLRKSIEAAAEALPSRIRCCFAGMKSHEDILNFYCNNKIDVFVNTSQSEGIPVSIMEAQAHGIPVVAPNVGGISEIVGNHNGFLLEEDFTPDDLASALILFSDSNQKINNMRQMSFLTWQKSFDGFRNYRSFAIRLKNVDKRSDP